MEEKDRVPSADEAAEEATAENRAPQETAGEAEGSTPIETTAQEMPSDAKEQNTHFRIANMSRAVGGAVCFLLVLLESLLSVGFLVSFAAFTIYFSVVATEKFLRYFNFRRRKDLALGIVAAFAFALFLALILREWILAF